MCNPPSVGPILTSVNTGGLKDKVMGKVEGMMGKEGNQGGNSGSGGYGGDSGSGNY